MSVPSPVSPPSAWSAEGEKGVGSPDQVCRDSGLSLSGRGPVVVGAGADRAECKGLDKGEVIGVNPGGVFRRGPGPLLTDCGPHKCPLQLVAVAFAVTPMATIISSSARQVYADAFLRTKLNATPRDAVW